MSKPLRLALWGLGRHAVNNLLPAIGQSPRLQLVGVYSRSHENSSVISVIYRCKHWSSESEMLGDRDVDVVYVATPVGLHFAHGMQVLAAGKHLVCEKSLAHDLSHSLELIGLAREKSLFLSEAFMYFHHPKFLKVLELVGSRDFGRIVGLSSYFNLPAIENPGYRYTAALGGGALLDLGCYTVSVLASLVADLPRIAYAELMTPRDFEVDTSGVVFADFGAGAYGHLSWGYGRAYRNDLLVCGEKQSLYVDRIFLKESREISTLDLFNSKGEKTQVNVAAANSFVEMLDEVRAGLVDESKKAASWEKAEKQARLMEAVRTWRLKD